MQYLLMSSHYFIFTPYLRSWEEVLEVQNIVLMSVKTAINHL